MANPQSIWARLGDIDAGARLTGLGWMRREFATRVRICSACSTSCCGRIRSDGTVRHITGCCLLASQAQGVRY